MKTYKNLFPKILAFKNLLLAAQKAAKGKREKPNVLAFFWRLEENLFELQAQLRDQTYRTGAYFTFQIYDPKPRLISAAPFRDRVVHHALMNIIAPLFERSFIYDSYANRIGKGTHRAIRRYQHFFRKYQYVLKCDIKKYFPSIDHEILKSIIRRRIADARTLWLIDLIIDGSNPQEFVLDYFPGDDLFTPLCRRKGLPIGNLTSQFFANLYLSDLDHFVKETLHCRAYLRYVDDFVLFSDYKSELRASKREISDFLERYRLKLHPKRCYIFPAHIDWQFLGLRIFRTHRLLAMENVRKFNRRLRKWRRYPPPNFEQRLASWKGHARQANCYCLLKSLDLI
ncbi:MAG: reverse transcriptase domain-containing protein [bacterium]